MTRLAGCLAVFALAACSSPSVETPPIEEGGTTTGVEEEKDTDTDTEEEPEQVEPVECAVKPTGYAASSAADLVYQNHTVEVVAKHVKADGCLNKLDLTYTINDGCRLSLSFETQQKVWILTDATFAADEKCAEWDVPNRDYSLLKDASVAALIGLGDVTPELDKGCSGEAEVQLHGQLVFQWIDPADTQNKDYFNIDLNPLGFSGTIESDMVSVGECPTEARLCQGIECGTDFLGVACGSTCGDGFTCAGGSCVEGGCVKGGSGWDVGDHIKATSWPTDEGGTFELQGGCGDPNSPAVWIIKTASW
jgi:hypothetical protein